MATQLTDGWLANALAGATDVPQPAVNVLQALQPPLPPSVADQALATVAADPSAVITAAPATPQRGSFLSAVAGAVHGLGHALSSVGRPGLLPNDELMDQNRLDNQYQNQINAAKIQEAQQTIAQNADALGATHRGFLGQAVRGAMAIDAAGGDASKAWPILAQLQGVDPTMASTVAQQIADPMTRRQMLAGIHAGLMTPAEIVAQTAADSREDVAHTAADSRRDVATTTTQGRITTTGMRDQTSITTTGMKDATSRANNQNTVSGQIQGRQIAANAKSAGQPDPYSRYRDARQGVTNLRSSLESITNYPGLSASTGVVFGHLPTQMRADLQARIDQAAGQAIPAAIAQIKASGGASPRAVAEIQGDAAGLTGAIKNTNQTVGSYLAGVNSAIERLNQRIRNMDSDAQRNGVLKPQAPAGSRPTLAAPPAAVRRVNNGGWGKVQVQ